MPVGMCGETYMLYKLCCSFSSPISIQTMLSSLLFQVNGLETKGFAQLKSTLGEVSIQMKLQVPLPLAMLCVATGEFRCEVSTNRL